MKNFERVYRRYMFPNPLHSARAWGWVVHRAPDWYFDRLVVARVFLTQRANARRKLARRVLP